MIFNPELSVSDFQKSLAFYTKILGFKVEYQRVEKQFAFLSLQGSQIMIEKENDNWVTEKPTYPYGRGINFQIEVENVEQFYTALRQNNYPVKIEIQENWYRQDDKLLGNKEFLVMDPDGYILRFAEDLGEKMLNN